MPASHQYAVAAPYFLLVVAQDYPLKIAGALLVSQRRPPSPLELFLDEGLFASNEIWRRRYQEGEDVEVTIELSPQLGKVEE